MTTPEVFLAGVGTGAARHICAIFNGRQEELDLLLPFARDGLLAGDHVVLVAGKGRHGPYADGLSQAGIDVPARLRDGQLVLVEFPPVPSPMDSTHIQTVLHSVVGQLAAGRAKGLARTRFIADMEWAVGGFRNLEDLAQLEARLDEILAPGDDFVICAYDSNLFSAGLLIDILRTHRMVLLGGMLRENPFYAPAARLLAEWSARPRQNRSR